MSDKGAVQFEQYWRNKIADEIGDPLIIVIGSGSREQSQSYRTLMSTVAERVRNGPKR